MAQPEPLKYATLSWTVEDVLSLSEDPDNAYEPALTEAEAEAFLERNANYIQERLCELGWEVIETYLRRDGLLK